MKTPPAVDQEERDPYVEGYEAYEAGKHFNRYANMREKVEEARLFETGWRDAERDKKKSCLSR